MSVPGEGRQDRSRRVQDVEVDGNDLAQKDCFGLEGRWCLRQVSYILVETEYSSEYIVLPARTRCGLRVVMTARAKVVV